MFKRFTNACVRVVNRWLPDAFLFAVILTFVVYVAAMFATGMGPIKVLAAWGNSDGFWGLLAFSMQMALVLVLGSAMASAKPCKKVLRKAAGHHHHGLHRVLLAQLGLRPGGRCAAGQGGGQAGPHRGLSLADRLRLFRLRHLARRSLRIHSPDAGHRRQVR